MSAQAEALAAEGLPSGRMNLGIADGTYRVQAGPAADPSVLCKVQPADITVDAASVGDLAVHCGD